MENGNQTATNIPMQVFAIKKGFKNEKEDSVEYELLVRFNICSIPTLVTLSVPTSFEFIMDRIKRNFVE